MDKCAQSIKEKLTRAFFARRLKTLVHDSRASLAADEEKWITTKKGENGGGGRRFLIDTETGTILKGGPRRMRGKTFAQAFETKQQKKERKSTAAKATREQGNALLKKLTKKGFMDKETASTYRRMMSKRNIAKLQERLDVLTKYVRNAKRRDKRRAEKEKSMGLLNQIEGR